MNKAEQTMVENLYKITGQTLEEWIAFVKTKSFEKHGQIMKYLKEEEGKRLTWPNL